MRIRPSVLRMLFIHGLTNNAYKYGFIKRYPDNKIEFTGVNNEPWHYRYVGVDAALEMQKKGLCLEEYIETLK